jgi:hypothetical protein
VLGCTKFFGSDNELRTELKPIERLHAGPLGLDRIVGLNFP